MKKRNLFYILGCVIAVLFIIVGFKWKETSGGNQETQKMETEEQTEERNIESTPPIFDKYGELGKEVWDHEANLWVTHGFETEAELREDMNALYGDLSTKEELIQDILALPRDPAPETQTPTQQESLIVPETQPQAQSQAQPTKPAPKQTQAPTQATKPAPKETQPAPQETAPVTQPTVTDDVPPVQESVTPPANNNGNANGLIPGTNLPSTGNAALDAQIAENQAGVSQDMGGNGDTGFGGFTDIEWK